jgi:hypothetical protein
MIIFDRPLGCAAGDGFGFLLPIDRCVCILVNSLEKPVVAQIECGALTPDENVRHFQGRNNSG